MTNDRSVKEEALALGPEERAKLIEALLASFDPEGQKAVDAAWAKEAEARIDAYDRGEMESISLEEFRERISRR